MVVRRPDEPKKLGALAKAAAAAKGATLAATLAGQVAIASTLAAATAVDPTLDLHTAPLVDEGVPAVLLPYQQRWIADQAVLKICEKGRRVGLTWAEAADAVLIAASEGGSNYFYISATQDMAREFIEACAMWTRAFDYAASSIGEGIYDDGLDAAGNVRHIKTYEIVFPATGRRIVALSSRPTNLRGKQGTIGIDEAAFHNDLAALIKAAMAMILWGNKVRIWSTHDGVENPFNQLVEEVRAGKRGGPDEASVHRVTFKDAVADGLYRRVCIRRGLPWSAEAEAKWVDSAYRFYGDAASEELDAIPSQSAGSYLSLALIASRTAAKDASPPLVRGKWDDGFAYLSEDVRRQAISGWLAENVKPHLAKLNPLRRHVFGQDFARNRDQSVITILEEDTDLTQRPVLTVELANCPFSCQEQILEYLIDAMLPMRWCGGAMDATGNGAALAEKMAQKYGVEMIEQVKLNDGFYLQHMPKLKAALQDGTLTDLPRDDAIRDDLRAIKLVQGIPKIPRGDTQSAAAKAAAAEGGEKTRRHGDYAIAVFMAIYASLRQVGEIDWTPVPDAPSGWDESAPPTKGLSMRPNHSDDWARPSNFDGGGGSW